MSPALNTLPNDRHRSAASHRCRTAFSMCIAGLAFTLLAACGGGASSSSSGSDTATAAAPTAPVAPTVPVTPTDPVTPADPVMPPADAPPGSAAGPAVPAAPTGVIATRGIVQVTVAWTAATGATSYNIYRSTIQGSQGTKIGSSSGASYADSAAANGTVYYLSLIHI